MSRILVTGASGFIGRALAASLAERHEVICMSRRDPGLGLPYVRGEFSSFEDLRGLDRPRTDAGSGGAGGSNRDHAPIDVVVHLAAVTGGCLERDGMLVNVEGTRCLMRHLMDRGCEKFVMASSIAAVGMQSTRFRPLILPIPDEHPCLDRDGYGFSKYMMEEVTKYHQRQNPRIDVINLRLSTVAADDNMPEPVRAGPLRQWALGGITIMALSDAVRAFTMAAEAPHEPGVRIMNAAGPRAWVGDPVAEVLEAWWADDLDLSYFRKPGREFASVYDVSRVKAEIGFTALTLPPVSRP